MSSLDRSRLLRTALTLSLLVAPLPAAQEDASEFVALSTKFGVHGSSNKRPDAIGQTTGSGAGWIRLNSDFVDPDPDFKGFLDAGVNVIITFANRDPANIDTTYGTLSEWIHAGFPFVSKSTFQQRIRDVVTPLLRTLSAGRQLWLQCENEIGDATVGSSVYWRGTTDQYLTMLGAFFEVARSLSPNIRVVLTSFASSNLDAAIDPSNLGHAYQTQRMSRLLTLGQYDAVDLHFYGCDADIPGKVAWFRANAPAEKLWISTENSAPNPDCPGYVGWMQGLAAFEQTEASEVSKRLSLCADNGGSVCLWFSLFDLTGEVDAFNHLGLIDPRVMPARQKPAYFAFQAFVASVSPTTTPGAPTPTPTPSPGPRTPRSPHAPVQVPFR
jgi:hypothetical protein